MDVEGNSERVIERPGKENINVKLADNTGKKAETAKRTRPRRRVRRFRNTLGRKNYSGTRNNPQRQRNQNYSNDSRKRLRGTGFKRRGIKIIVRNLTRSATNSDIKSVFEKFGRLRRCGINWNSLGESKGTAEVEYFYRDDAFRAFRKLDYKSIKGSPMRLEIRDGQKRILVNRLGYRRNRSSNTGGRRFRTRNSYKGSSSTGTTRRNRSYSQRNSARRGLRNRNRNGRRDGSRSERRYRNYN
jgi:RNA recognition motif-containing protein